MNSTEIFNEALDYQCQERHEEAIETYMLIPSTAPEYAEAMLNCARIYSYLNKNEDAISAYYKVPQGEFYNTAMAEAAYLRADEAYRNGNYKEAISFYEKYAELKGIEEILPPTLNDWALSYLRLGWSKQGKEKSQLLNKAIEIGKKVIEKAPNNAASYDNYGIYLFHWAFIENKLEEVKDEYLRIATCAYELGGGAGASVYNVACLYSLENDIENAFLWLERALQLKAEPRYHIENDSDLDNIKNDPRFKAMLDKYL